MSLSLLQPHPAVTYSFTKQTITTSYSNYAALTGDLDSRISALGLDPETEADVRSRFNEPSVLARMFQSDSSEDLRE